MKQYSANACTLLVIVRSFHRILLHCMEANNLIPHLFQAFQPDWKYPEIMIEIRILIESSKDRGEFFSEVTMASFSLCQYWWKQQSGANIKTTITTQKQRWSVTSQGGWNDHRNYSHGTSVYNGIQWLDKAGLRLQGSMLFPGCI